MTITSKTYLQKLKKLRPNSESYEKRSLLSMQTFFPRIVPRVSYKPVLTTLLGNFCKKNDFFCSMSENVLRSWLHRNKYLSSNCSFGHSECSFDNPPEKYVPEGREFLLQYCGKWWRSKFSHRKLLLKWIVWTNRFQFWQYFRKIWCELWQSRQKLIYKSQKIFA